LFSSVDTLYNDSENQTKRIELPKLVDPILLKAAQKIYRTYCEVNPNMVKRPTGVVINQLTYRGQLLFQQTNRKNVLYR